MIRIERFDSAHLSYRELTVGPLTFSVADCHKRSATARRIAFNVFGGRPLFDRLSVDFEFGINRLRPNTGPLDRLVETAVLDVTGFAPTIETLVMATEPFEFTRSAPLDDGPLS